MNSKLWIRRTLSAYLCVSLLATCSMVALASPALVAGELLVTGSSISGEAPTVFVNGETAKSGRSVFSSSTIATPENASAVISFGRLGQLEVAPNSSLTISLDNAALSGNLTSGKVSVLSTPGSVVIQTLNGESAVLTAGQSILASGAAQQDKDDDDDGGGGAWIVWSAVFIAAGALIIYAATSDNDRITLGDGGTVISPTR